MWQSLSISLKCTVSWSFLFLMFICTINATIPPYHYQNNNQQQQHVGMYGSLKGIFWWTEISSIKGILYHKAGLFLYNSLFNCHSVSGVLMSRCFTAHFVTIVSCKIFWKIVYIKHGVPQGSILGTLVFINYIIIASSICLRATIFQNPEGTLWIHCIFRIWWSLWNIKFSLIQYWLLKKKTIS
jgi:hypothetical protein